MPRSSLTWLTLALTLSGHSHASIVVKHDAAKTTYEITVGDLTQNEIQIADHAYIEPRLEGIAPHEGVLFRLGLPRLPAVRFAVEGAITDRAIGDFSIKYGGAGHTQYFWEDYHLFGDPSLLFRTDLTRALHAEVEGESLVVTDEAGQPVAGARVAVIGNGVAYSDGAGKVPLPPGEWTLAVTAHNARLLQIQANRR